jgi:hypothetical protein
MITSGINEPLHGGFDDAKVRVRFIVSNFFVLFPSSLLRQMLKIATNRGHGLQICRIPHPELAKFDNMTLYFSKKTTNERISC